MGKDPSNSEIPRVFLTASSSEDTQLRFGVCKLNSVKPYLGFSCQKGLFHPRNYFFHDKKDTWCLVIPVQRPVPGLVGSQTFTLARFPIPWLTRAGLRMSGPTGFLDSLSPWASRSNTPKPAQIRSDGDQSPQSALGKQQQGGDHRVSHRHRLSLSAYPDDCPSLSVRWYYAVDVCPRSL